MPKNLKGIEVAEIIPDKCIGCQICVAECPVGAIVMSDGVALIDPEVCVGCGKCLDVWFEAVIGYLSAAIEWSELNGTPDAWRDWWQNDASKTFYFIGKDNIPFHAIIWPAELIGMGTEFDSQMRSSDPLQFV